MNKEGVTIKYIMSKRNRADKNNVVVVSKTKKRRVKALNDKMTAVISSRGWKYINITGKQSNESRTLMYASCFRIMGSGIWEYMLVKEYLILDDIVSLAFVCKSFWRVFAHVIKWEILYGLSYPKMIVLSVDEAKQNSAKKQKYLDGIRWGGNTPDILKFKQKKYAKYTVQYNVIEELRSSGRYVICSSCFRRTIRVIPKGWLRQARYSTHKCLSCFMKKNKEDVFEDHSGNILKLKKYKGETNVLKLLNFQTYKSMGERGIVWPKLPGYVGKRSNNWTYHRKWRGFAIRMYFKPEVDAYIRSICTFILNQNFKLSPKKAKEIAGKISAEKIKHWYQSRTNEIKNDIKIHVYEPYIEKILANGDK